MTMNSGHAVIVQDKMSHLQQQAQEKDAEVHRQQRELQTLRVRTYCCICNFSSNTSENSYMLESPVLKKA